MSKTKARLSLACVLAALLLTLASCSTTQPTGGNSGGGTDAKLKIYLVTMDRMDLYWTSIQEGCIKAVDEIGKDLIDFTWDGPADGKEDGPQVETINNAVANGANAIILAAHSAQGQNGAIEAGDKAGVKFIYVDSPASWDGALQTIKTDNEAAGKLAGTAMLEKLRALGKTEGSIGIVSPDAGSESTIARDKGFRSAFEGSGFTLLATQYGEGKADLSQNRAEEFITSGVVGLFGANEGSAVGISNAIKEAGKDIVGIGFDTSPTVLTAISDGTLIATMAQDPKQMGYLSMKNMYEYLKNGKAPEPKLIDSGVILVTKDNLSQYQ